jgi:hypothetical protein
MIATCARCRTAGGTSAIDREAAKCASLAVVDIEEDTGM